MDTTENKTEQYTKNYYPEKMPVKTGYYVTDRGMLKWDGIICEWQTPSLKPTYFFELSPPDLLPNEDGILNCPACKAEFVLSMDFYKPMPPSPPMEVKDAEEIEDVIPNPIKDLIREVIMRQGLAFPETEQDLKWSEQKPDHELMVRLFEYLKLGDGIEGDIRNNKDFWNKSDTAKTYLENPKPHYFVRHNLDKNDRFCDKCGLYFTDKIHLRTLI